MAESAVDRLKKIAKALRRPKKGPTPRGPGEMYSLEKLVSITRRKSLALEERIPRSEVLMKRNEILYRLDPLVWAGVNKLSRLISSPRVFFTGSNEDDVVAMEMFIFNIGLRSLLPALIKDIFIYGYGVAEIIRNKGKIVGLAQIDPKSLDYIRLEGTQTYIERNRDGSIKGYVQKIVGQQDKTFKPSDILLVRFYLLGEECLGLSPLESIYKSAWIKLNLEEALGEAVYRHGYPIYWYKIGSPEAREKGFEVTPEKVKEAENYLKKLSTASELILPWWIEPGRLDAKSQIGDISDFLQYLSAEIMAGFEVPKVYGTTTGEVQSNVAAESLDFEKTIKTLQEMLVEQLSAQLFSKYREEVKMQYPYPKLNFTEHNEETKMFRSRRLAQYAKYNLLTPDESLEMDIRRIEGLTQKKKVKASEKFVFGVGQCPVRKNTKLTLEKLAKFCASCYKRNQVSKEIPVDEEEERVEEEDGNNEV